jgi:pyridoxal phosphate enzyme (YggS family)
MADRREQLAGNLRAVHARIDAAATAASRDPAEVTLVVVTKTWPASDVRLLAELGVSHVGENRDQEGAPKAAALADLTLRWHFIGQLQTNKVKSVARYADVVESVDRGRLVTALDRAATDAQRTISCLIQVGLDAVPGRGGVPADRVDELAEAIAGSPALTLAGVMAVAPLGEDPLPAFERLAAVAAELRRSHPEARAISAGMSGDLEAAVACGATHVRVGSAVLGQRLSVG